MDAAGCADVVVAGNSMGRDAFDPARYGATDPAHPRAYNASLDAASPVLLEDWLPDEVVPRLHPSTVVMTLASLDFNRNGNATRSALAAYDTAALTTPGVVGSLQAWATRHSALFAHRHELRDPAAVPAAAIGPSDLRTERRGRSRLALHYRHDVATKSFTRDQLLTDYAFDDGQVDAAEALVTDLQGDGVTVVLAVLPVTKRLHRAAPERSPPTSTRSSRRRGRSPPTPACRSSTCTIRPATSSASPTPTTSTPPGRRGSAPRCPSGSRPRASRRTVGAHERLPDERARGAGRTLGLRRRGRRSPRCGGVPRLLRDHHPDVCRARARPRTGGRRG